MKKTIILLTIAAVVGIGSYVVFAKEHMGGGMMQKQSDEDKGMMKGKEMSTD